MSVKYTLALAYLESSLLNVLSWRLMETNDNGTVANLVNCEN